MNDPIEEVEVCGMQMEGRPIQNSRGNVATKPSTDYVYNDRTGFLDAHMTMDY